MALWRGGVFVQDPWRRLGASEALAPHDIVPLDRWADVRVSAARPVGVLVPAGAHLDALEVDLPRVDLIALDFPKFSDGRAYSTARVLRERLGFGGELRAVGDVLFDQIQLMARCGFDAFEIDDPATIRALGAGHASGIPLFYQPGFGPEVPDGTRPWARRAVRPPPLRGRAGTPILTRDDPARGIMRTDTPLPVRLSGYRPPAFLVDTVDLVVSLGLRRALVRARLAMRPNSLAERGPLRLDGDGLVLVSVSLDGEPLDPAGIATPDALVIADPPARPFVLDIETELDPSANTKLMGLYRSGTAYCTQCEAEGFRRITYFPDRPDVLARYTTRIEADRLEAPVLLGNGNLSATGDLPDGRHFAVWTDPFPKPSYLFALVAGDLGSIHSTFTTASGRQVALGIHTEPGKEGQAAYAMDALKRCMGWDEEAFGCEYDLDVFNIVAVSDFNMGAMENKGLNVFNDKLILASPETATDSDYAAIEAVVAHEYFHNWTGNRITCRDWFQLCLKEGLTVFRDQEFTADQRSRSVKRIADVRALRSAQFAEDASPLAHSVRPETYLEINNFYTATVYEKGAEIVRVLKTLIGARAFRSGMDLYFQRHDGTAATVEDFISCFAETSGRDLAPFSRWYAQAGTPILRLDGSHDEAAATFTLDMAQRTDPTPGQPTKTPLTIPVALALLARDGEPVALAADDGPEGARAEELGRGLFELDGAARRIIFRDVPTAPVLSALRGFSAPVRLETNLSDTDLVTLIGHDDDSFNRWQSAQTFATRLLLRSVASIRSGGDPAHDEAFAFALAHVVDGADADPAMATLLLTLPSESDIARELGHDVDPDAIHTAREHFRASVGRTLESRLLAARDRLKDDGPYAPDAAGAGRRAFRNGALHLVCAGDPPQGAVLARHQIAQATNMTDHLAALDALVSTADSSREEALDAFRDRYQANALVIDKWLSLQAMIPETGTLARVERLMAGRDLASLNPNRVRALVGAFAANNPTQFNAADGSGHAFLAKTVLLLDARNPQVAARLANAFRSWRTLESGRRASAEAALRTVTTAPKLSPDLADIVHRCLG